MFRISDDTYQNKLGQAWKRFTKEGNEHEGSKEEAYDFIRPEILASWERSKAFGIDPFHPMRSILKEEELGMRINSNLGLIEIVRPYMEMLYSVVKGTGSYILFCDKDGYILDCVGDPDIILQAGEQNQLVAGASRSEAVAGTNAIGTCLTLQKPIQVCGEEHYLITHKKFACSGAPVFDGDGNMLGCLNITLNLENTHPHTLGMAIGAADGIAKELRLLKASESIALISAQRNSIIQSMHSGVFLLNTSLRVIQVNQVAMDMLGVQFESIMGKCIFDVLSLDGNLKKEGQYRILEREVYNKETTVSRIGQGEPPKKFNVTVNYVRDASGTVNNFVLRFNETKLIHKLVNTISGYKSKYTFDSIIGQSPAAKHVIEEGKKAARNDSNVLILGESGTGKELIAQAIHNASEYSQGPFVAINCAALPKGLVESELFGYERGAFTGANQNGSPGKFELADGGSIFLDEIGEMPLEVQTLLLRVIQTREIVRIGGKYPKQIHVRIIAATNKNLLTSITEKTFREDLYYRLNVFTIQTPPLRERRDDIRILADYFVSNYNNRKNRSVFVNGEVYPYLDNYSWPGNIRELENVIERAINISDSGLIKPEHLPEQITGIRRGSICEVEGGSFEHQKLIESLQRCRGNVTHAAKLLKMNRRTFYRKMEKYGIENTLYRGYEE